MVSSGHGAKRVEKAVKAGDVLRWRGSRSQLSADAPKREAVSAVREAAGHGRSQSAATRPAGLTQREIEVLRLVACGYSNKQIANDLAISARTAQHHVIHIYAKIGVSSRATAALFAVEHDLLSIVPA